MGRETDSYRIQFACDFLGYRLSFGTDYGERSRPEILCKEFCFLGEFTDKRKFLDILNGADMDNEGVVRGSALCCEDSGDYLAVKGVCCKTVATRPPSLRICAAVFMSSLLVVRCSVFIYVSLRLLFF